MKKRNRNFLKADLDKGEWDRLPNGEGVVKLGEYKSRADVGGFGRFDDPELAPIGDKHFNGKEWVETPILKYYVYNIDGEVYTFWFSSLENEKEGIYTNGSKSSFSCQMLGIKTNGYGSFLIPELWKIKTGNKDFSGMNREQIIDAQKYVVENMVYVEDIDGFKLLNI